MPGPESAAVAAIVPSLTRAPRERLHDLTTSLNAVVPETSTRIVVAYRVSTTGAVDSLASTATRVARFNFEARQELPVRLPGSSRTDLIVVIRNLSRDVSERGSLYDELLTIRPPLHVMGGVQVRF